MDLESAKIMGVRQLQDANLLLLDASDRLAEHTSPAFEEEAKQVIRRIRDMIGAVQRLEKR